MNRLVTFLMTSAAILIFGLSTAHAGYVYHEGPGLVQAPLITQTRQKIGHADVWNNKDTFQVHIYPAESWQISDVKIYVGSKPVPATKSGNLIPGKFPYQDQGANHKNEYILNLKLADLGFNWGTPSEENRVQNISVFANLEKFDAAGNVVSSAAAWAYSGRGADATEGGEYDDFEGMGKGWWFSYLLSHPKRAHFVDSPVGGVTCKTPTTSGVTDGAGAFDYFPGETVALSLGNFSLGSTLAAFRISPLDLFEQADMDSIEVINMARLLQSLDADGAPQEGIAITPQVIGFLETVMAANNFSSFNFMDSEQIETIISGVVELGDAAVPALPLVAVSAADAQAHLDKNLSAANYRKNVSKTPSMGTSKAKLEIMPVLVPATVANNDPAGAIGYYDEDGTFLYDRPLVKPLVAVYADQIPETGASDVFGAISRDDGKTWKRMNLSRTADLSSITLPITGKVAYGDTKKPNIVVRGNKALVAWTSHFCRGGKPLYSRDATLADGTSYPYYEDDIWGVGGSQRSHEYTEEGFPGVELPYSCVWAARGTVDPVTAEINWLKPERLTSARRDAYQISVTGAENVGFAIIWQEDPEGLRPGSASGPGHGWSGATASHTTDIWYSTIKWSDFNKIDTAFAPNGDPEHSFDDPEWTTNRPMPLVPFKLPIRISDNDVCNTDTMKVVLGEDGLPLRDAEGKFIPQMDADGKHAGAHRYCYEEPGLCTEFYEFTNNQEAPKKVCVTTAGVNPRRRLLDGDTGASRPNINFMPYTKADATQGAWVAVAYEETKGVGGGVPEWDDSDDTTHNEEKEKADLGKNVIYHSFNFDTPDKVSAGTIVNLPEQDTSGNAISLIDEFGSQILDWEGQPQLAYENARRPRFLPQPAGQAGLSNTVMVLLYKQGKEGKGRPSDIFMRRIVNPKDGKNPYAAKNLAAGAQNISSVKPTKFWTNPNAEPDSNGDNTKVVEWTQAAANLADASDTNPYDDARAHRGNLKGDNLFIAYTHTPNWAAARNGHDKYDLYVRRSFNGGKNWGTDPNGSGPVTHTNTFKDYTNVTEEHDKIPTYDITASFLPGAFEPARNLSKLTNNKESIIEPRLVAPPSSVKGSPYSEDVQDTKVFYVAFGTETNLPKDPNVADEDEEGDAVPLDLYYTLTRDKGQSFYMDQWEVNPDSTGNYAGTIVERFPFLAKGDPEQSEAQLRMSPDGSKFYAIWNEEGVAGSDSMFRRIMSPAFPQNQGTAQ